MEMFSSFTLLLCLYVLGYTLLTFAHKGINFLSKERAPCSSLSQYFNSLPEATCLPPVSDYAVKNSRRNQCPPSLCFLINHLALSEKNCCINSGEEYICLTCP